MGANYPTRIILAFRSGGVCAFPKCGKHLTYDATVGDDTYIGGREEGRGALRRFDDGCGARYADIVLPVATPWERESLRVGFEISEAAENLIQLRPASVAPRGEARSDLDIVFALAKRLGFGDQFFDGDVEAGWNHILAPLGITAADLRRQGGRVVRPLKHDTRKYRKAKENGTVAGFPTETRRVELYSELLLRHGQSPLPTYKDKEIDRLAYREWLPADGYEANCSIGGSFVSRNIEDYYLSPFDLNYGSFIKFDHEFVGREALEKKSKYPGRKKVSLVEPGELPYKYLELPMSTYAVSPFDRLSKGNKTVGISMFTGYAHTERAILSLGVVNPDIDVGDELTLVWGEESGGTRKPTVERHRQLGVQVRVAPAPFSKDVRDNYVTGGWRQRVA